MKVSTRVDLDIWLERLPVISAFNSISNLWQQHAYKEGLEVDRWNLKYEDDYHQRIIHKNPIRILIAAIPILGNFIIFVYDIIKECAKKPKPVTLLPAEVLLEMEERDEKNEKVLKLINLLEQMGD